MRIIFQVMVVNFEKFELLTDYTGLIGATGWVHFPSRDGLPNLAGNLVTVRSVSSTKVSYSDSYNP